MIIVTHELNFAKDVADRVILMEKWSGELNKYRD